MNTYGLYLKIFLLGCMLTILPDCFADTIRVSEKLHLIELNKHVYIHTENGNNGIVYVNDKKAVIISTPENDEETNNLINYIRKDLKAQIIGCIVDRWHPDAMGGLKTIKKAGIPSYAYEGTRTIAQNRNLPIPEKGFNPRMELTVGKGKLICHYLGEAHTSDGIVVWIPNEKILFGGNEVRSKGWYGNIEDANLREWSNTIKRVKELYGSAEIVVPGHGEYSNAKLLDYTINLYEPSLWGRILKWNNEQVKPIFNNCGSLFEIAESDFTDNNDRHLNNATVYVLQEKKNRYLKIQSPGIRHDNTESKIISSKSGRLQIYDIETNILTEDLYFKDLTIILENDYVDALIILKEAIR